jgi:hypothetical protein
MIARIWRGVVQLDDADEYADYIRDTGFTEYAHGRFSATLSRRGRAGFGAGDLLSGTTEERPGP